MTREETFEHVREILAGMFEIEHGQITEPTRLLEDLELDSMDAIDMAVRIEEMTGRRADESALRQLRTVGDVVSLVQELRRGPA